MKAVIAVLAIGCLCASAAVVNYTYDAAGRLVKVDYGNGSVIAYAYDNAGNLTARTVQTSGGRPQITSVTSGGPDIAQNTWVTIKGSSLVPANTPAAGANWNTAPSFANGQLPTQLNGVSVSVNGKSAYVDFFCSATTSPVCASDQINVLTPLDSLTGPVPVVVTNGTSASPPFTANLKTVSPAFLLLNAQGYIAATHADFSLIGPAALFPGVSTPAKPGETILAYAVGFGLPTGAITGGSSTQTGSLPVLPVCQIGGTNATVGFAGLISPGLYQLNLVIPTAAANGDNPIGCTYSGTSTPSGALITVQK